MQHNVDLLIPLFPLKSQRQMKSVVNGFISLGVPVAPLQTQESHLRRWCLFSLYISFNFKHEYLINKYNIGGMPLRIYQTVLP